MNRRKKQDVMERCFPMRPASFGFCGLAHLFRRGTQTCVSRMTLRVHQSGCCPSCAFHAQSVSFKPVNTAVKLDSSGLQA